MGDDKLFNYNKGQFTSEDYVQDSANNQLINQRFDVLGLYSDPKFIETNKVNSVLKGELDTGIDTGLDHKNQWRGSGPNGNE